MKEFYIIDKRSSTTIFHRSFFEEKVQLDSDLLSGMLSALNQLSEVEMQGRGIDSIEMGGLSWVYQNYDALGIMLIAADIRGKNVDVMRARLEVILRMFLQQFNINSPEDWARIWTGEYSKFDSFKETLDQLIQQWGMAETAMGAAELFDMLGTFQQVFHTFQKIFRTNFFNERFQTIQTNLQEFYQKLQADELDNEELQKIEFTPQNLGWNILSVNPQFINALKLKKILLLITKEMKVLIVKTLGRMLALQELSKEIFPFIVQNMDMFERLEVHKEMIQIFLT